MKSCPICSTAYADHRLKYCRLDGAMLVDSGANDATVPLAPVSNAHVDDDPVLRFETLRNAVRSASLETGTRRRRLSSRAIDSLAVLPFENDSSDSNMDYFSDGITESIINTLSQLPKLRVIARNTMFRYKGRDVDTHQISKELGVRSVLTGRVRRLGDRLMIAVELIDAANDSQLWGDHHNRRLPDIFEVQEEIAREICEKLQLRLNTREKKRLYKRHTDSAEAYELYLKGRYHWNRCCEDGFRKSIEHFERALEKDPRFALAYSGLCDAYGLLGYFNHIPSNEAIARTREYALKALEIDNTLAEAYLALAEIKLFQEWDWRAAEKEFTRALYLNPNCAPAHHVYAHYLVSLSRFDEAVAEAQRARELDPLSLIINCGLAFTLSRSRNPDGAIQYFQKALELDPDFPLAHEGLGASYLQKEMCEEALTEYLKMIALRFGDSGWPSAFEGAYRASGMNGFWRTWIDLYRKQPVDNSVTAYFVAGAHAMLGEKDQAFEFLEKAHQDRISFLVYLNVEPLFDGLRSDPRFANLLNRIGLSS